VNLVVLLFALFAILIALGVPIAVSLTLSSLAVIVLNPDIPLWIAIQRAYNGVESFVLLAIPFFILSGSLMNEGGITNRLIRLATALVGHIRGGLAHVAIVVGMLFAGISGSSTAESAAISTIFYPALRERGYREDFAVALTAAASTMGVIIPPSILMVIYGAVTNVSIGALFIGGALPGVLIGLSLMVFAYGFSLIHRYPRETAHWLGLHALLEGVFTATEASVIATLYALLLTTAVYRSLPFHRLVAAFAEAGYLTANILFCVAAASMFGWLLAFYSIPDRLAGWFLRHSSSPTVFLLLVVALFLILGTFMDAIPAIIIFVPMLLPIADSLHVHPVVLGVVVVMTMALGLLTLPYGLCTLIACGIARVPVSRVLPILHVMMIAILAIILLCAAVPGIILLVPRLLAPKWV
jgi:TRAP-type C4-dicarboxylate transport system permease large subunit